MSTMVLYVICFAYKQTRLFAGKVAAGTVIGTLLGEVVHLSFCFSDERVAACSGSTLYILSSKVQHNVTFQYSFVHINPH